MPVKQLSLKLHAHTGASPVLALCDSELLGKVFESGDLVLDLKKYRAFYDGEKASEKTVVESLAGAANVNAVGERSVALACKALGVSKAGVRKIGGVPHLQVYRL